MTAPESGPPRAEAAHIMVLVACADEAQATRIARALIEARAAACVQSLPIRSTYRWRDEILTDSEVLLLAKTRADAFARIEALVRAEHEYEVPEIVAVPFVAGTADYLGWIDREVGQP